MATSPLSVPPELFVVYQDARKRPLGVSSRSFVYMQSNGGPLREDESFLGCAVNAKTSLDEDVSGTICAIDPVTNLVVITEEGSTPGSVSYRFLNTNFVKEIISAERPLDMNRKPAVNFVREDECIRREREAVRAHELRHAPRVEDIETGQKLYSKLSVEYVCKWEGMTINIDDKVFVDPPYTINNFRSSEDEGDLRETLKLMVDEES